MNLLFCIDRRALGQLAVCLRSIVKNGGAPYYRVFVMHSDLDEGVRENLGRDFPSMEFQFLPVSRSLFDGFPVTDRYPKEIYYRLAAPLVLPHELDRILYLDADTLVLNPLRSLYDMDFQGNLFIACTHTRELLTKLNRVRLKSEKAVCYINSGVLLMNLPVLRLVLDLKEMSRYVRQRKLPLLLPDQDILTALYGDRVKLVSAMRYNLSDRVLNLYNAEAGRRKRDLDWVRSHTAIVHYCGRNKPWKPEYSGTLGVFYDELFKHA